MLPIEHPDFFRRPPPPGQSRESTIVLDAAGRFWHEGEPVEHRGMREAFAAWVGRHPDDGRYVLCNGYDWSYFRVEDVGFFVRGVRSERGTLVLALSDGTEEELAPATLRAGAGGALYCSIKQGTFEAKFTPTSQAGLLPYVVESASGEPALRVGERDYLIPARE
jgi:hypothetical protein